MKCEMGFYTTYKELKLQQDATDAISAASFYTTYKELKQECWEEFV